MIAPLEHTRTGTDASCDSNIRTTRRRVILSQCQCLYCDKEVTTTDGVVDHHYRTHDVEPCLGVGGIQPSFERLTGVVIGPKTDAVPRYSKAHRKNSAAKRMNMVGAGVYGNGINAAQAAARRAVMGDE